MKRVVPCLWLLAASILFEQGSSLRAEDFREGTCGHYTPQQNFNSTWHANVGDWFVSGGSKYHLYRVASNNPQITDIREFEFMYQSCLQVNMNMTNRVAAVSGFDIGVLGVYDLTVIQNGIIDFYPRSTETKEEERKYVTLTDNKSFVFFVNCWMESRIVAWNIITVTPTLPATTLKRIEDHAVSLGFDREKFIFLQYDSCKPENAGKRLQRTRHFEQVQIGKRKF